MANSERAYWLAWSQIKGVGPILLKRLAQHFELLENAWKARPIALGEVEGFGHKLIDKILEQRHKLDPFEFLEQHQQKNSQFLTPADPDYPQLLWEIPSPPPVLYYLGRLDGQESRGQIPGVGIVGTRYPTEHGSRWTRKISQALAKSGFTVISGLAAGIDADAHSSCLRANGRTIAVLGTGLDLVYPPQNRQLFEQIAAEGLILSEYPVGTKPERGNFPARNRIIAGLSRAILVMEAPPKSGALITADYANDFNRDVFSLPNSPDIQEAHGCLHLLHKGAEVILSENQLLASLGAIPLLDQSSDQANVNGRQHSPKSQESWQSQEYFSAATLASPHGNVTNKSFTEPPKDLDPKLKIILSAVQGESTALDQIVSVTALGIGEVSAGLLQLEIIGLISQQPGMRYQRR
ncbi:MULTISPECIES: DNA-processing protein DprA [unclassified Synechocystis]|uniref:DNA-processing protein DprA n=1 Tax=unclassified Synechocystis TaxID=2640012 RepID=UPI00041EC955|nr:MULTISPECIES: DNA-processing protein DprA [unclassified Synechocystis]MCT0254247.1 DNA-processing protein DprA [Synechocystis sp. CS-94]